jgi:hypothetical protein
MLRSHRLAAFTLLYDSLDDGVFFSAKIFSGNAFKMAAGHHCRQQLARLFR